VSCIDLVTALLQEEKLNLAIWIGLVLRPHPEWKYMKGMFGFLPTLPHLVHFTLPILCQARQDILALQTCLPAHDPRRSDWRSKRATFIYILTRWLTTKPIASYNYSLWRKLVHLNLHVLHLSWNTRYWTLKIV
jgi:hypothetical protein